MHVRTAVFDSRLNADKTAGDLSSVEDPGIRISSKNFHDLLFRRKHEESRLQQTGADHRWRVLLGHGDGARRTRLKMLRLGNRTAHNGVSNKG